MFNKNKNCPVLILIRADYFESKKCYRKSIKMVKCAYFQKLHEKIEDGNIIDWRNFNKLKTARELFRELL